MMKSLSELFTDRRSEPDESRTRDSIRPDEHVWERWSWAWHVAFYLLLAISLGSSLVELGISGEPQLAIIALSVVFAFWYWLLMFRPGWIADTRKGLIYVSVAIVLWFLLVLLHPVFHLLLFVLFAQVYSVLPMRLAIPGSVVLTGAIIARGFIHAPENLGAWVAAGVLSVGFGAFFGLWIDSIVRQSIERRHLIDELESTREDLAAQERRNGVLEERSRLAREIHDTLAQGFISIVTHLEAAETGMSDREASAAHHLRQAKETARENLGEARRLVAALQPEMLESSSIDEALERLTTRFSESSGIRADLHTTGDQHRLPQGLQVTLLRVAQEALSNIRKHSRASRVTLTLSYLDDLVLLDVQDDGIGFTPAESTGDPSSGYGLSTMRQRIEQMNGRLLIETAPNQGTTLAVQLPLNSPARLATAVEQS